MDDSLGRFLKNYINARKSMEIWRFLNHNSENREIVNQNKLFSHLRRLAYRETIIELVKILKDSDSYVDNVFALLRKQNTKDSKKLLFLLNEFKIGSNPPKETGINGIVKLRNMIIAHLDPNYERLGKTQYVEIDKSFQFIEKAITVLGIEQEYSEKLKTVTMRDEFNFDL